MKYRINSHSHYMFNHTTVRRTYQLRNSHCKEMYFQQSMDLLSKLLLNSENSHMVNFRSTRINKSMSFLL
jgi:hypothetical protein